VCPSPARETAPGFSLRGRGAPQKHLGFLQIASLLDVHLRANDLEARMTKLEKDRANSAAQDFAGGEIFR
jgi:hypothetical protein